MDKIKNRENNHIILIDWRSTLIVTAALLMWYFCENGYTQDVMAFLAIGTGVGGIMFAVRWLINNTE